MGSVKQKITHTENVYAVKEKNTNKFLLEVKGHYAEKGRGYTLISPSDNPNLRIRTFTSLKGARQALIAYAQGEWSSQKTMKHNGLTLFMDTVNQWYPTEGTERNIKDFEIVKLTLVSRNMEYVII